MNNSIKLFGDQTPLVMLTVGDFKAMISREVQSALCEEREKSLEREEMSQKSAEEYLSREDVARLFGVDKSTLWRWNRDGMLPNIKMGSRVVYARSEIDRFVQNNQSKRQKNR